MLKNKWLQQGFGPSVHIVQESENQNSVPERKNITSIRILPPLDKTDKTHKTPSFVPVPIPAHIVGTLLSYGYIIPEWTPQGCQAFLAELKAEWSGFEVRGWHGLTMPECWPVVLMDAVQSVYVQSLQDQGEA